MIAMVETPAAVVSSIVSSLSNAKAMLENRLKGDFTAAIVSGTLESVIVSLQKEIEIANRKEEASRSAQA